jgi:transposase-like protein
MKHILKREYTTEFKEQAVGIVNNGRSVPEVAGELGLIARKQARGQAYTL